MVNLDGIIIDVEISDDGGPITFSCLVSVIFMTGLTRVRVSFQILLGNLASICACIDGNY